MKEYQQLIMYAENISTTPQKLAVNLLTSLFSFAEQKAIVPSQQEMTYLLDQKKIQAIRGKISIIHVCNFFIAHIAYEFPVKEPEEKQRWKEI